MKKLINQNTIYIFISLVILLLVFWLTNNNAKTYETSFSYMDTYINIKIKHSDATVANEALKEAERIYKEYHELTDRYNAYEGINNVYYINNTTQELYMIKLDAHLYDILAYGKSWYYKSNGIKNINLGNVIDVWKKYQLTKTGVPTNEELTKAGSIDIENIVLLEDNYILNNHPNIDLGSIAKGYTTQIVGDYFKSKGITSYIINAGGNVLVGKKSADTSYNIGIQDPDDSSKVFKVIIGNNIAVVTSGGYERYYEYEGVRYSHIINPMTLFPANLYKSVTVICDNSALGDSLSLILFVLPIEEGKVFIKDYPNVEAIWYTNDDQIVKSDGFNKYEQ